VSRAKYFPRRLSFPKICDILVAYLNAGADKDYVGVSEVVEKSHVTLHNISRNNNFLKSWGLTEESEKEQGKYRLTQEAARFASAYRIDPRGDNTRQILGSLLSKDEAIGKFVERIRREGLNRQTVLVGLQRVVGDLRADRVGMNAFVDMLGYTFQIEELYSTGEAMKPQRKVKASQPARRTMRRVLEPSISTVRPDATLSITLSISPEVSPERLKDYVKAVLEAYEEHRKSE